MVQSKWKTWRETGGYDQCGDILYGELINLFKRADIEGSVRFKNDYESVRTSVFLKFHLSFFLLLI